MTDSYDDIMINQASRNEEWMRQNIRTCPVCNKTFCTSGYNMSEYLYKSRNKHTGLFFVYCSYTCWRKSTK